MLRLRLSLRLQRHLVRPLHTRALTTTTSPKSKTNDQPLDISSLDEASLNSSLFSLVSSGQYSAAERLRLKISSNGLHVEPRLEYFNVALACLRNRKLTGTTGVKLDEYKTWLDLIPDRENVFPSSLYPRHRGLKGILEEITKEKLPFSSIVDDITFRALIPGFLPFVSCTNHALASKGYSYYHFLPLARPLIINARNPFTPEIHSLISMETRAVRYEASRNRPTTAIARFIRGSLIQLFLQRGWVSRGTDLILQDRDYTLDDRLYSAVLEAITKPLQVNYKQTSILERWEKDKEKDLMDISSRYPDE